VSDDNVDDFDELQAAGCDSITAMVAELQQLRAERDVKDVVPRSRVVAMDEEIEALKAKLVVAYAGAYKLSSEYEARIAALEAENERQNRICAEYSAKAESDFAALADRYRLIDELVEWNGQRQRQTYLGCAFCGKFNSHADDCLIARAAAMKKERT
jgi:hypothetical protein